MADGPHSNPTPNPRSVRRSWRLVSLALVVLAVFVGAMAYHFIVNGGLIARQKPSHFESYFAQRLIDLSIPKEAKKLKNPLGTTGAAVFAGRELYQKNCEVCHGYDGKGRTAAGAGTYPPPTSLSRTDNAHRSDGELFYLIRNGIRNTAMPGWQLPDEQTWQIVSYIRCLPLTASLDVPSGPTSLPSGGVTSRYVGSVACQKCHAELYERWKKTPMANVVRDPREHPEAILPDLTKADPLVHFTKADVALVYGSLWKQRYFKKVGDDYFVFPAQWDITNKKWSPYVVKADWWVPFYPPDNFQRPTSMLCDGCHSVNYDVKSKTVTEWNVGCERCHGPGSEHVKNALSAAIYNPARADFVAASDVCISCHSQGRPVANPIQGKYYDWPVGYDPTLKLSDFWRLEDHKLGETTFTHFADGTAHKNRMQGNDYVGSQMYSHGVTCFSCHDVHGTDFRASLRKAPETLCLDCHGPNSPNGPHAPSIAAHTHHLADSTGSQCIACHMPRIAQTLGNVNVSSHTFRFVSPASSDSLKIPNACNVCHTDKTSTWVSDAMKTWAGVSPWRVTP